jgi:hypothetical protein
MAEEHAQQPVDVEQLVAGLRQRVEQERAAGAYADDLAAFELERPQAGQTSGARVRFRPELGFSSKRVIGPPITLVKRVLLRLQLYVFDDLAQQADEAIERVENRLAVEIATRERLESELEAKIRELEAKIRLLEDRNRPEGA